MSPAPGVVPMPESDIELSGVSVTFNEGTTSEVRALRSVDLVVGTGEYISVIGPNGAGKSTLINVLAGAVRASSGSIKLRGVDVTRLPAHKRAKWIGRVFQDPKDATAAAFSLRENMALAMQRPR